MSRGYILLQTFCNLLQIGHLNGCLIPSELNMRHNLLNECFNVFFFHFPFLFFIDHIKRKIRRRPSWGRGIIRKKKIHKKGAEEEEEPEAEVDVTGPSDSCLTQDEESSCDTSGPQTNGHLASTEEDSSNEPPDVPDAQTQNADGQLKGLASKEKESVPTECEDRVAPSQLDCLGDGSQNEVEGENSKMKVDPICLMGMPESLETKAQTKHTDGFLLSEMECVNGIESMDSMDSQPLKGSGEAVRSTPQSGSEGSQKPPELDEHNARNKREPTQEHLPQDTTTATENVANSRDKEGIKLKNSVISC